MNKKGMSTIETVIAVLMVILVVLFLTSFGPKIVDLIKTAIGLGKIDTANADEIKRSEVKQQDDEWSKIMQDYEKNKCVVDKRTCKVINNYPCKCFSSGLKEQKKPPEECNNERPFCYDGTIGCSRYGPDNQKYFYICQESYNFNINQIPECKVDVNCKATNFPCKCLSGSGKYDEICLEAGDIYCYKGSYGCYHLPC